MIFSQSILNTMTTRDKEVYDRMQTFYGTAIAPYQEFCTEANIDNQFLTGSQEFYNRMYGPEFPGRMNTFYFNRIRPIHSGITGRQRQQRKTTVVVPRENASQETADQLSKVLMWVHDNDNIYDTISQGFEGACATGFALLQVSVDYRSDPLSGDIHVDYCPYNYFMVDPYFTKPNLSDCTAIWRRTFLTKREIISLLPAYKDEILDIPISGRDGKFNFNPNSMAVPNNNRMIYDEFWYRDYREQTLLLNTKTGESFEWTGPNKQLTDILLRFPYFEITKTEIPTVKCAITIEGRTLIDENILGLDCYPFVPCIAYFNFEMPTMAQRFQGVVRSMRDPQWLFNRKIILEAQRLESTPSSGWIYKEGTLVNPDDLYKTGTGRSIAVKKGNNIGEALLQIQPSIIQPAEQQLRQSFADEIAKDAGYNEELLGSASDDIAGVLSMLRQGAGLVTLEKLFSQIDYTQKLLGNIIMQYVQSSFMPGKIQRILGKDVQISPEFHNRLFGRYDCVVEEGVYTSTQKQMQFTQLMELRKLGVAIPDSAIMEAATVQNKTELIKAISEQAQAAQQQAQHQQQMELENMRAQTEFVNARAQADKGRAIESLSKVKDNAAMAEERKATAEKEEQLALLNFVKALKEIENIDLSQIEKLIYLSKQLNEPMKAVEQNNGRINTQGQLGDMAGATEPGRQAGY